MYGLSVSITKNSAAADLNTLIALLKPEQVKPIVGRSGVNLVRNHLFAYNDSHENALGGKRTNYFADAARSTEFHETGDGVEIGIHKTGIRLHFAGGTVTPINRKYLTIPARAEAHGRRAGEFNNLQILWGRRGPVALVETNSQDVSIQKRKTKKGDKYTTKRGATRGGGIMFWLVKQATIRATPEVIPSDETLLQAITADLASYISRRSRI